MLWFSISLSVHIDDFFKILNLAGDDKESIVLALHRLKVLYIRKVHHSLLHNYINPHKSCAM
jgi:hypothetical protein